MIRQFLTRLKFPRSAKREYKAEFHLSRGQIFISGGKLQDTSPNEGNENFVSKLD